MRVKKIIFFVVLTVFALLLLLPVCVAASTEKQPQTGLFFMETPNVDFGAVNILLLSDAKITEELQAVFIVLGGSIEIDAPIDGIIFTLFTNTVSTAEIRYGIINLKNLTLPFDLIAGLALLAVFKDSIEQTAAYIRKNNASVVKFGLYGYIMALLLIGIFIISVVGAFVAAAGMLALCAVTIMGHVPAAVALGYTLRGRLKQYNVYILFAVGIVIIDAVKLIPIVGDFVAFAVMPVLSLGAFSVYIIHKHFYKAYVMPDFDKYDKFNRDKMKSIILRPEERRQR